MARGRVEIGNASLAYQAAGAGEPVLLVHGLAGSGRWWAKNVGPLAARFRVHVVDLLGFGESRGGQGFALAEAAGSLIGLMDGLGLARAHLIGHSMGGFVCAALAADRPDRVGRLVLVDAPLLPFARGLHDQALRVTLSLRHTPPRFLPLLATDAYRSGPLTIARAARELLAADLRPQLARIEAPTLIIWGEHDRIVPIAIGEQLVDRLPDARLVVIPGAGHNPMWDRPDAFNREVLRFLGNGKVGGQPSPPAPLPRAGRGGVLNVGGDR